MLRTARFLAIGAEPCGSRHPMFRGCLPSFPPVKAFTRPEPRSSATASSASPQKHLGRLCSTL